MKLEVSCYLFNCPYDVLYILIEIEQELLVPGRTKEMPELSKAGHVFLVS